MVRHWNVGHHRFLKLIFLSFFSISTTYAETTDPWQFEIAPYLWVLNMNGRVQTGPIKMHIDQPFNKILSQFNYGGMLWAEAGKDKFDIFFNGLYSQLSNTVSDGPVSVNSTNIFAIYTAGIAYQVFKKDLAGATLLDPNYITLEPYVGGRYTRNDVTLKINPYNFSVSNNQSWTDPIVGARMKYIINKHWKLILAGDVGGTNLNNHNSYNLNGIIGYTPSSYPSTRIYAGYRLLYQHYLTGNGVNRFDWDMKIYGPMLGVGFTF